MKSISFPGLAQLVFVATAAATLMHDSALAIGAGRDAKPREIRMREISETARKLRAKSTVELLKVARIKKGLETTKLVQLTPEQNRALQALVDDPARKDVRDQLIDILEYQNNPLFRPVFARQIEALSNVGKMTEAEATGNDPAGIAAKQYAAIALASPGFVKSWQSGVFETTNAVLDLANKSLRESNVMLGQAMLGAIDTYARTAPPRFEAWHIAYAAKNVTRMPLLDNQSKVVESLERRGVKIEVYDGPLPTEAKSQREMFWVHNDLKFDLATDGFVVSNAVISVNQSVRSSQLKSLQLKWFLRDMDSMLDLQTRGVRFDPGSFRPGGKIIITRAPDVGTTGDKTIDYVKSLFRESDNRTIGRVVIVDVAVRQPRPSAKGPQETVTLTETIMDHDLVILRDSRTLGLDEFLDAIPYLMKEATKDGPLVIRDSNDLQYD